MNKTTQLHCSQLVISGAVQACRRHTHTQRACHLQQILVKKHQRNIRGEPVNIVPLSYQESVV